MQEGDAIPWLQLDEGWRIRLSQAARLVLPRHDWVKAAYLHGSAIRGGPARDVDLALLADPVPTGFDTLTRLAAELEAESGLPRGSLDLRLANGGSPVFLGRMLGEAERLYEADAEARIRFEVRAISQWLDFKPVWERMRAKVLHRWANG